MHDGMPYGRNQGQGQGHSREVDRQSLTGLIFDPSADTQFQGESLQWGRKIDGVAKFCDF